MDKNLEKNLKIDEGYLINSAKRLVVAEDLGEYRELLINIRYISDRMLVNINEL